MEKLAMNKLKKRIKDLVVVAIILLTVALVVNFVSLPCYHVKDNTITRDLSWMILPMPDEPTGRTVAWDSELPEFVKQDIEYAEENGYEIEYEFKGNIMSIENRDGDWRISIKTRMDTGSTWDSLTNFSMYQTKDHKIILYGYCFGGKCFQKITLKKNESRIDTITYDPNLPLDEFSAGESIGGMDVGEYSLLREEQTFIFYKDGEIISSQDFPHGKIETIDLYRGLLLTDTKKLYMMYANLCEGQPKLTFTYINTVDSMVKAQYSKDVLKEAENNGIYLSMVQKYGKYYAVVPNDWQSFDKFSVARATMEIHSADREFDYSIELANLETSLKEVCFHCTSGGQWYATIMFDFNGREFYTNYFFGGYDESTCLPENDTYSFDEKRVTSFDEMWETIDEIRKTYFNYYECRGDFAPAAPFL